MKKTAKKMLDFCISWSSKKVYHFIHGWNQDRKYLSKFPYRRTEEQISVVDD